MATPRYIGLSVGVDRSVLASPFNKEQSRMAPLCPAAEAPEAITDRDHILAESSRRRTQAEALLRSLMAAKSECERQLARFQRSDVMQSVTGRSAIDAAIVQTRRMIESLDRAAASCSRQPQH